GNAKANCAEAEGDAASGNRGSAGTSLVIEAQPCHISEAEEWDEARQIRHPRGRAEGEAEAQAERRRYTTRKPKADKGSGLTLPAGPPDRSGWPNQSSTESISPNSKRMLVNGRTLKAHSKLIYS
ncbi:hypothetical protein FOZ63_010016, partial [Perkinsus olseni]